MKSPEELSLMGAEELLQYIEDAMLVLQQELARRYDDQSVRHAESGDLLDVRHVKIVDGEVVLETTDKSGRAAEVAARSVRIHG